nr:MAG TPA: hypothetical protein [Caudoviricetes sp.]
MIRHFRLLYLNVVQAKVLTVAPCNLFVPFLI